MLPAGEAGQNILDDGSLAKARATAYLTWPSNTILRKGSRKLALSSITSARDGARTWLLYARRGIRSKLAPRRASSH